MTDLAHRPIETTTLHRRFSSPAILAQGWEQQFRMSTELLGCLPTNGNSQATFAPETIKKKDKTASQFIQPLHLGPSGITKNMNLWFIVTLESLTYRSLQLQLTSNRWVLHFPPNFLLKAIFLSSSQAFTRCSISQTTSFLSKPSCIETS